jgi:hypothetical protein
MRVAYAPLVLPELTLNPKLANTLSADDHHPVVTELESAQFTQAKPGQKARLVERSQRALRPGCFQEGARLIRFEGPNGFLLLVGGRLECDLNSPSGRRIYRVKP